MSHRHANPIARQVVPNLPGPPKATDPPHCVLDREAEKSHPEDVGAGQPMRLRYHVVAAPTFHGFFLPQPRRGALSGLVVLMFAAPPLLARAPSVRFDTAYLVSCRDVTTDEFTASNPRERLIEGRFRVTAIVDDGQLPGDMQFVYRFLSPAGRLRVVDYQPKTRQATAVAGNVIVETKKESSKSLGVSVSGSFESLMRGTAGSDIGSKKAASIRCEFKPPMEVVLVAGTVERGTGVYFKMWPSPDCSLQGSREFLGVMRVPSTWRGDVMYVRCEALQNRWGKLTSCDVTRFVVGLYAEGDDEARLAAEDLVLSEALLRRTVTRHQKAIQKRSVPSLVHKVGTLLDVYAPRIPDTWLDRLIYGSTSIAQHDFYGYLPKAVRRVADKYRRAKRRMYQLSGSRLAMRAEAPTNG